MKRDFLQLCKRTIKSLTKKEELFLTVLVVIAGISGYFSYQNLAYSEVLLAGSSEPVLVKNSLSKFFSEGMVGEIKRLNPVFVDLNPIDRDVMSLVSSGLTRYDAKNERFVSDLATHTLSVDKKKYTFSIRSGVTWHDGKPLTAEDVYFTYHDIIQHPDFKNPVLKANFNKVVIEKPDANTVTFTLESPNSFFYTNTVVGILPKHILKDVPVADLLKHDFNLFPIGTGPYKLKEPYERLENGTTQVTLEKNKDYYGQQPKIETIKFTTYPDMKVLMNSRNSLHGIARITDEMNLQMLREDDRFSIYKYTLPRYTALFLNTESKILTDKNVRLALSKSINKDELVARLEHTRRIDTPLLELNQEEWLHKSNIEEAKGALFDAGWKLSSDGEVGRENISGQPLKIRFVSRMFEPGSQKAIENARVIEYLKNAWESIGFMIDFVELDEGALQEVISKRDYDVLLSGQDIGYNLDTFSYWHSTQTRDGGLNLSNYTSPTADALIESIRNLFDKEDAVKKQEKLTALQSEIASDVPVIVLYTPLYYYGVDARFQQVEISNLLQPSDRFSSVATWFTVE